MCREQGPWLLLDCSRTATINNSSPPQQSSYPVYFHHSEWATAKCSTQDKYNMRGFCAAVPGGVMIVCRPCLRRSSSSRTRSRYIYYISRHNNFQDHFFGFHHRAHYGIRKNLPRPPTPPPFPRSPPLAFLVRTLAALAQVRRIGRGSPRKNGRETDCYADLGCLCLPP